MKLAVTVFLALMLAMVLMTVTEIYLTHRARKDATKKEIIIFGLCILAVILVSPLFINYLSGVLATSIKESTGL